MKWWRIDELILQVHGGLGPQWTVLMVLVLAVAFRARLSTAFGLALLLLVASQSWYPPARLLGNYLRWWVLLVICVRGIATVRALPRPPWESNVTRLVPVVFAALAVLSSLWAGDPFYTFGIAVSFAISIVASFWVLWRLLDVEDVTVAASRGAVWLALIVFGSGFLTTALALGAGANDVLRHTNWDSRFSGVLWNANMSGLLAMICIPAIVAAPRAWLGFVGSFRWVAIGMAVAALLLSGSRSALVGTVLALLILFLYRFGVGAALTIAVGTAGIVVVAATGSLEDVQTSTAVSRFTRTKHLRTLSGRVELWEEGIDAVQGHMALGLGWGQSRLLHGADAELAMERGHVRGASNLHSTHVQVLVDVGLVGLAVLWTLCLQVLWSGWRLLVAPQDDRSVVNVMVLACFVATFADTFVHGSVLSTGSPSALLFWASSAILLKAAERAKAQASGWIPAEDREPAARLAPETA